MGKRSSIMKKFTGSKRMPTKFRYEMEPNVWRRIKTALRTTLNWKAPGRGQIGNFWLK
jgi:hypothetical protein